MEDNNNNLEKFFRDKFNQRIEPQEWNIPDNEVWDGIASEISKEDKKRRVGVLPILIVGASILLGLWMGIDNYQKGKDIARLEKELKECSNQSNPIIDSQVPAGILDTTYAATQSTLNKQPTNQVQKTSFGRDSKIGIHSNKMFRPETADIASKNTVTHLEENVDVVGSDINDNIEITEQKLNTITTLSSLTGLNFTSLKSFQTPEPIDFHALTESIKPSMKTTNGIVFGPVVQYIHWQDKIKGSFNNPLSELLIKEETSPSIALGIAVAKKLGNRFVFNTGMLYYQRNQTSQYAINLPYSIDEEINVGTEFENRFSHSLPTGLGNINTNLVLSRSINSPVTNNENVYLDFSLQNHTKALALPFMLTYYLKRSDDGFFVRGGIFNEFIIQNEIREINTESHHTFVKDKSIAVDYNKSQVNKFNVTSVVGIGYEKEIFKGIGISLSANYGFALTNTFATPNYQHKIDQSSLQLMVMKRLK